MPEPERDQSNDTVDVASCEHTAGCVRACVVPVPGCGWGQSSNGVVSRDLKRSRAAAKRYGTVVLHVMSTYTTALHSRQSIYTQSRGAPLCDLYSDR